MSKMSKKTPKKIKDTKEKAKFEIIEKVKSDVFLLNTMIKEKKATKEEIEKIHSIISMNITGLIVQFLEYTSTYPCARLSKMASALLSIPVVDIQTIIDYSQSDLSNTDLSENIIETDSTNTTIGEKQ